MMNKEKYTLQILKNKFLKINNGNPKINNGNSVLVELKKYNLREYYSDKNLLTTNNKSKIKMYLDLIGAKSLRPYQTTSIAGYIFYE